MGYEYHRIHDNPLNSHHYRHHDLQVTHQHSGLNHRSEHQHNQRQQPGLENTAQSWILVPHQQHDELQVTAQSWVPQLAPHQHHHQQHQDHQYHKQQHKQHGAHLSFEHDSHRHHPQLHQAPGTSGRHHASSHVSEVKAVATVRSEKSQSSRSGLQFRVGLGELYALDTVTKPNAWRRVQKKNGQSVVLKCTWKQHLRMWFKNDLYRLDEAQKEQVRDLNILRRHGIAGPWFEYIPAPASSSKASKKPKTSREHTSKKQYHDDTESLMYHMDSKSY